MRCAEVENHFCPVNGLFTDALQTDPLTDRRRDRRTERLTDPLTEMLERASLNIYVCNDSLWMPYNQGTTTSTTRKTETKPTTITKSTNQRPLTKTLYQLALPI